MTDIPTSPNPSRIAATAPTSVAAEESPCPKCGRPNPVTVPFCMVCHARLRYACPACRHLQPEGKKCEACGVDFVEYEARQLQLAAAQDRASASRSRTMGATILGALVLVLAVGAWWAVRAVLRGAEGEPRRALAARGTALSPARTGPTEAELQAEALHQLQGLRGRVQGGTNYLEYGQAAFEVDKTVSRYVSVPEGDAQSKNAVRETMDLYRLAGSAWYAGIRMKSGDRDGAAAALTAVSRDPAVELCQATKDARDGAKSDGTIPIEVMQGVGVVSTVPAIFECANSRLGELEGRLAAR